MGRKQIIIYAYSVISILIFTGCIEQVELDGSLNKETLIVDAVLTTDFKKHQINLSYSYGFNNDEPKFPQNAVVKINDENGNTFNFRQVDQKGTYQSINEFKAVLDVSYSLEVQIKESGKTYRSKPEKTSGTSNIESINARIDTNSLDEEGLFLTVKTFDSNDGAQYFKYDFIETYKIIAPYWNSFDAKITSRSPFEFDLFNIDAAEICYVESPLRDIIVHDISSQSSSSVNFDFLFIEKNSPKINERYSILLKQRVQSFNAYDYFKALKKISSSDDVFSNVQTGNLNSNIISDSGENVIGYFEVSYVSSKRIFFNYSDFYSDMEKNYVEECSVIQPYLVDPVDPTLPSPLLDALAGEYVYFDSNTDPDRPFILTTNGCKDCRVYGSKIKPNFWID